MTASNTPTPGDDRAPDERPDATTEILAGLADPDRTPTEALGPDADHTATAVLGPDADADRTTKVLPEASAHSTLVPPKPRASDPTTRAATATGSAPGGTGPGETPHASTAPQSATGTAAPGYPRPHVRWAGIIWGLVFAAAAALLLWMLAEPARREAVGDWWASLTPIGFALTALLVAGGLLLIGGIAGLARRISHGRV